MPEPRSRSDLPVGSMPPKDLEEASLLLVEDLQKGDPRLFEPVATGMPGLDTVLGGGLHGEDLILLGGPQNVGKTAAMLNWTLAIAGQGALAIVVCYEHSVTHLLQRLLCIASAGVAAEQGKQFRISFALLREAYRSTIEQQGERATLTDVLDRLDGGKYAWGMLSKLLRNIWLVHGDSNHTDPEALAQYLKMADSYLETNHGAGRRRVMLIDYAQIVPVRPQHGVWLQGQERSDFVIRSLNTLAKKYRMPIVAVSAADDEALKRGRVHIEDMLGGSIVEYEPGTAVMLNRDAPDAQGNPIVRWSLEKNRMGPSELEWRHYYDGEVFCFETEGKAISLEESWQSDRAQLQAKE